jgi:hypothetical protein
VAGDRSAATVDGIEDLTGSDSLQAIAADPGGFDHAFIETRTPPAMA